ncbi:MAG: hypothetical protein HYV27_25310 [Candidatus Hydrogenedentes bacterium]|nr:hypothetical protein [Candidatus Hydrogenedentota bacterium]
MKKHVTTISRAPELAQSTLCTDIADSSQVKLCFALELLTSFVLPIFNAKTPSETR